MTDCQPVVQAEAEIVNPTGLHARPCHSIAALANEYESSLRVGCREREVEGRSILALMTLEAAQGDFLRFAAQGRDAQDLILALTQLVRAGFRERS